MNYTKKVIDLLRKLIATQSFSREEDKTAAILENFLAAERIETQRIKNNVWSKNRHFDPMKPTLLLNSHHDTVRPNKGYQRDPFSPQIEDGKLFGLGSNDAGGCLISLLATFWAFYDRDDLPYNLVFAASAEEEIAGESGMICLAKELPPLWGAIVGEPTLMQAAVSEKGLMVLDGIARGKAGHAAREEGDNAIYRAIQDIGWFRTYQFPKVSPTLGAIKMSVTMIEAGLQHNVVPPECKFVVDIRTTDAYSNEETLAIIRKNIRSEVTPRTLHLKPSFLSKEHLLFQAIQKLTIPFYGSVTLSDMCHLPCPAVKMGPGDSARSHTADEFIFVEEIEDGISKYSYFLETLKGLFPPK